jgi:HK97 family phage portal protein
VGFLDWFRPQQRSITLADFPALRDVIYSTDTSGIHVNEQTAFQVAPFWNGVDIISSQVAILPRLVYRRLDDDTRERASNHPAFKLLVYAPNRNSTPFTFWQTMMVHLLTWGNCYAEIEFDNALRPIALWPIYPTKIREEIRGDLQTQRIVYVYDGKLEKEAEDILHVPGLGWDGIRGHSVIHMARRSLGLTVASETFGSAFFGNGAWPGLVLEHPGKLTLQAQERLTASIENRHQGSSKAHRTLIAEEGMKVQKVGIPPEDAQFLETREFQVVEIARWLNLPPRKLKLHGGEAPTTPEAGHIEFLTDCLQPWLTRIEQECSRKLIPAAQRGNIYVEHLADANLRMDAQTRAATYKTYVDMGVMTPETVAKKENLPPPEDRQAPISDRIENLGQLIRAGFDPLESLSALGLPPIKHTGLVPVTVKPEEEPEPAQPQEPPPDQDIAPDPQRVAGAVRALCVELVARFTRREGEKAQRAARRGAESFSAWVEDFYAHEGDLLARYLAHAVELRLALEGAQGDARIIARDMAEDYMSRSKEELLDLPRIGLEEHVGRLVEGWELLRPHEIADKITAIGPREVIDG